MNGDSACERNAELGPQYVVRVGLPITVVLKKAGHAEMNRFDFRRPNEPDSSNPLGMRRSLGSLHGTDTI